MVRPTGFSEEPQPFGREDDAPGSVSYARLKIDNAGRVVIPAGMRAAMMVKPGETVTCEVRHGELRILSRSAILRQLREEAERSKAGHPGSAVDALIAERREEARREDERYERITREAAPMREGTEQLRNPTCWLSPT